jgi:hypothetical protein
MGLEHDTQNESMTSTIAWTGGAVAVLAVVAYFMVL